MKVSIVIPVYNGANYVEEALHSALSQTYRNIEIVTVNDGSRDGGASHAILTRYQKKYPKKIRYIDQPNQGVAGALNTALRTMSGDIFTWLSHDDLFEQEKTERQVDFYRSLQRPDACLFSDFRLVDAKNEIIQDVVLDHEAFIAFPRRSLMRGLISGCTIFIPKNVVEEAGGFELEYRHTQDYRLWRKILNRHEFFHLPEILVRSRQHAEQDSLKHDAVTETEALWDDMIFEASQTEQIVLYGSPKKYYSETATLLKYSPNKRTAMAAAKKSAEAPREALVSVLLPWGDGSTVSRSAMSVLAQTHERLELLLLVPVSATGDSGAKRIAAADERVRLVQVPEGENPWNVGLRSGGGDYFAFLRAGDRFEILKIEKQLGAMMDEGRLLSHTSFSVTCADKPLGVGYVPAGRFGGDVYPQIISGCPIELSTVMMQRFFVDAGFTFDHDVGGLELQIGWIDLAQRASWLGKDEMLSSVRWSTADAPLNLAASLREANLMLDAMNVRPQHAAQSLALTALRRSTDRMTDFIYAELGEAAAEGRADRSELDPAVLARVFAP